MSGGNLAMFAYLGNLVGILITKFGLFLQKVELMNMEKEGQEDGRRKITPAYCRLQWNIGLFLLFFGGAMQVVVLPYADLVLISTNAIAAILFNTFLSVKFLGEKFVWKYDVPAYTLMSLGAIVIVLQASSTEKQFGPDEMKVLLMSLPPMIATATGGTGCVFTLMYMRVFL